MRRRLKRNGLINFSEKKIKKEWSNVLVHPRGAKQLGSEKKSFPEGFLRREIKSFKSKRENQILRQVATHLFHRWKHFMKMKLLQEVQIMQVMIRKEQQSYFFYGTAANPAFITKDILDCDFQENGEYRGNITKHVTLDYGQRRSKAYSRKLKYRLSNSMSQRLT